MRLVCRFIYDRKAVELPIRELPEQDFLEITGEYARRHPHHTLPTGMPTIWAHVGTDLRFWPAHDPAYTEIVDLDHGDIIREKRGSQTKNKPLE
jgi:hypothetical protein